MKYGRSGPERTTPSPKGGRYRHGAARRVILAVGDLRPKQSIPKCLDAAGGARPGRIEEWHDARCKPGFNPLWDERDQVIAKITEPSGKA